MLARNQQQAPPCVIYANCDNGMLKPGDTSDEIRLAGFGFERTK